MKIAVFSTQPYDKRFLEETNSRHFANHGSQLTYHVFPLSRETVSLA